MTKRKRVRKTVSERRSKKPYGPAEIFVALVGVGFLVFVIGLVVSLVLS